MTPTNGTGCTPGRSCRWRGALSAQPGFQRHHLIPIALLRRGQMADMFDQLRPAGFVLHRFDQNGLLLPACEGLAMQTGHALHRGPHAGYSDVVMARVETIRVTFAQTIASDPQRAATTAIMRLRTLQVAMRRALTDRHGLGFWLNRRDPMRLFADRPYLDDAIDRVFACPVMNPSVP